MSGLMQTRTAELAGDSWSYPYEASIIDLCPAGHWCVVHWLHLCRVVGHAGGEQDGGQSTRPVFLSPSNSVVLLKYANHSGKGWCCIKFNEGSTGWKVSRFHLAFVPENGGSTCNAWPFFLHHQNVGHHIFRETNVLPTIPTLAVISATSIRWQDRGPLFPGSSCFPLSPDHKHKRGKLRMIPDLGRVNTCGQTGPSEYGDKHPDPCLLFWRVRGWVPYPWIWIDFRGAVCLRPSCFLLITVRRRGLTIDITPEGNMISLPTQHMVSLWMHLSGTQTLPRTSPRKFDGFSPKTTIFFLQLARFDFWRVCVFCLHL